MTRVRVVAAVVERDGAVLLGRRPEDKRHGGLWEFPGGKLDADESVAEAARRELAEELALRVTAVGRRLFAVRDPASPFVIEFHRVEAEGEPRALEHTDVAWVDPVGLSDLALAPADEAFARWYAAQSSVRR